MSLKETLAKLNNENRTKIPEEFLKVMDQSTDDLIAQQLPDQAIQVGDTFPQASLTNASGNTVDIQEKIKEGPVVISFYRGGWCPYCNIELKALENALPKFKKEGANLLAITPETPDNSITTKEKNELTFEVLSDIDNKLAKELGLVFQLPEALDKIYQEFGINVEKHNANGDNELPIPATFVVSKEGKVVYRFLNEDYTKRADIPEILEALKAL
ncbi:AhpC/TSA family protein [Aquimarina sp. ERC-38]|uniref:peroxiredoxin-like family protein n=1 Tax=Aquimarina sp. ERC-38 TaxID=2949996 RepID=UPI002248347E|nr:peroxiredoxin-like family protein [Aquimarina sp. ERC-38]UZO79459.1 AhpC/TSA family protein [Aquimarina sp. ERC-38]